MKCPENWKPFCLCSIIALEPNESCYIHGSPDLHICPYCGAFKKIEHPCKRCGFRWKLDISGGEE